MTRRAEPSNTLLAEPGGLGPTIGEVRANLVCGAPWARSRDIPDVAGWVDLAQAPSEVRDRLARRIADGRCPSVSPVVTLPKPGSDELRKLVWMDPFDELWMRILVGRMVASIDRSLDDHAEVFSYRLVSSVPAWSLGGHRSAHRARRRRGDELLAQQGCRGVGTLDIRHYYPSVSAGSLASTLSALTVAPGALALLCRFLEALEPLGMPAGLPIGPEASGVLGNAALIGVDQALSDLGCPHVRYTDDSWVFLDDPATWGDVMSTYGRAASVHGLVANDEKVAFHPKSDGSADEALSSGRVDSMLAAAGGFVPPEMAAEELDDQLSGFDPDWTAVRFSLGALSRETSTAGLRTLYGNPDLFIEAPVQTANYLMAIAEHKTRRRSIGMSPLGWWGFGPP